MKSQSQLSILIFSLALSSVSFAGGGGRNGEGPVSSSCIGTGKIVAAGLYSCEVTEVYIENNYVQLGEKLDFGRFEGCEDILPNAFMTSPAGESRIEGKVIGGGSGLSYDVTFARQGKYIRIGALLPSPSKAHGQAVLVELVKSGQSQPAALIQCQ